MMAPRRSFALAALSAVVVLPLVAPRAESRPDRPPEALVARVAGSLHWWGTLSPDAATPRLHREHGCAVMSGVPTAAEERAFYVARDGEDRRGLRPRCEVRLSAAGDLLGWGHGPPGVVGPPPPGGRIEEREPSLVEVAEHVRARARVSARERAIALQAQAMAATTLGLSGRAAELLAEAQAALAEAQR